MKELSKELGIISGDAARLKLVELLLKDDATDLTALAIKLRDLLTAHVTKVFSYNGNLIYSEPLKDNKTQLMTLQLIAQIFDALPSTRHEVSGPSDGVEMTLNLAGPKRDAPKLPEKTSR